MGDKRFLRRRRKDCIYTYTQMIIIDAGLPVIMFRRGWPASSTWVARAVSRRCRIDQQPLQSRRLVVQVTAAVALGGRDYTLAELDHDKDVTLHFIYYYFTFTFTCLPIVSGLTVRLFELRQGLANRYTAHIADRSFVCNRLASRVHSSATSDDRTIHTRHIRHSFHFASAFVAVIFSQLMASSSASWRLNKPPSNFVIGDESRVDNVNQSVALRNHRVDSPLNIYETVRDRYGSKGSPIENGLRGIQCSARMTDDFT